MKFTQDFYAQAEYALTESVDTIKPKLIDAFGKAAHHFKADNSVVTELDGDLELIIRGALRQIDASIGFEGEEHGKEGNQKTRWLIDPIDGTELFIRGLPATMTAVTLVDNDVPVYCFIYKFITNEIFIARKGMGALCNGKPISISDRPMKRAWIESSITKFNTLEKYEVDIRMRSAAHQVVNMRDYTLVAKGNLDGLVSINAGGNVWDYAPRALLIAEAGGTVTNIGSDTYDYRDFQIVGANPIIFEELWELTKALATKG